MTTIHEPDRHLVQWVYVSTAARVYDGADLDALLDEAVRNNLRRGLTGMLLYADSGFMGFLKNGPLAESDQDSLDSAKSPS